MGNNHGTDPIRDLLVSFYEAMGFEVESQKPCDCAFHRAQRGELPGFGSFFGTTEVPEAPEPAFDLQDRLDAVETDLVQVRTAIRLAMSARTLSADNVLELTKRQKDTDSILASHSERTDALTDRVFELETMFPVGSGARLLAADDRAKRLAVAVGRLESRIETDEFITNEVQQALSDRLDALEKQNKVLLERSASLEESLLAQGRQLEELMLWRDSVVKTETAEGWEEAAKYAAQREASEALENDDQNLQDWEKELIAQGVKLSAKADDGSEEHDQ